MGCGQVDDVDGSSTATRNDSLDATIKYYVATSGCSDSSSRPGTSASAPLCSLEAVRLRAEAAIQGGHNGGILTEIDAGKYYCRGLKNEWTRFNGQPITFKGAGTTTQFFGKTSDSGSSCADTAGTLEGGRGAFFSASHTRNETVSLNFMDFNVGYYMNGIAIYCDESNCRAGAALTDSKVDISRISFSKLGGKYFAYGTERYGLGAVMARFTSNISIKDSRFRNIENIDLTDTSPDERNFIHAVYVAFGSQYLSVDNSYFEDISSGAIKVRDYSNFATLTGNTFTGLMGVAGENRASAVRDSTDASPDGECPSWALTMSNNVFSQTGTVNDVFGIANLSCHHGRPGGTVRATIGSVTLGPDMYLWNQ